MNLEAIFQGISGARVGVIGDFCLDLYWHADMRRSQLSRETPHHPLPIVQERMSPGGAGNVACNIAALEPARVLAIGVIGTDWRGQLLKDSLSAHGVGTDSLIEAADRVTNAYIKPMRAGLSDVVYEDPRLDFENYEPLRQQTEERLLRALDQAASELDVLCVCDQMAFGAITPRVRARICALGRSGLTVIVDSRDRIALYEHVIVKPNEVEAARATGEADYERAALSLSARTGRVALVTLGAQGCLVARDGAVSAIAACKVEPPIDIVGAGDTFLSAFACAMAAGADACAAARVACAASSVTVKKIGTTGTASRMEWRGAYGRKNGELA